MGQPLTRLPIHPSTYPPSISSSPDMSMYAIAGTRRDRQPPADRSLSKLPPASQSSGSEIAQRLSLNLRPRCQPTTTRLPEQIERCSLDGQAGRQTYRQTDKTDLPASCGLGWLPPVRRSAACPPLASFDGCQRDGRNMRSPITLAIPSCTWCI